MAVEVVATRRRFTRAEYYRMAEAGILREDDRVELIRGEIVEMAPLGLRHNAFVGNLTQLLVLRLAGGPSSGSRAPSRWPTTPSPSRTSPSSAGGRCRTRNATPGPRTRCW